MSMATSTVSIAVPTLKLGARDAAKVEQRRALQASANKAELSGLREQVAALERALETKQETDRAAVEQVESLTPPPHTSVPRTNTCPRHRYTVVPSAPSAPSAISAISAPAGPHPPHPLRASCLTSRRSPSCTRRSLGWRRTRRRSPARSSI